MNTVKYAFDEYAQRYDSVFSRSKLGTIYRDRVWQLCYKFWPEKKLILELNCGTGEDAVELAKWGNYLLATDISSKMLDIVKAKAIESDVASQIATLVR